MADSEAQEVVESFIEELDFRIAGGRDTPAASRERLAAMRSVIVARVRADPEGAAAFIEGWLGDG